jgi:hypothetical protein
VATRWEGCVSDSVTEGKGRSIKAYAVAEKCLHILTPFSTFVSASECAASGYSLITNLYQSHSN